MNRSIPLIFSVCVLAGSGCNQGDASDPLAEASTGDDPVQGRDAPTFFDDVAPILADACGACHRTGGVAPMSFDTYEETASYAPLIAASVAARTMPPWNVNNDGSCNTFSDARWLGDEEIELITRWASEGTPAGDPSLGVPPPPAMPSLDPSTVTTFAAPTPYRPQAEGLDLARSDDYQCFLIDPGLQTDRFIVGFDVAPGNPAIVHHVLGFNVDLERLTQRPGGGVATNGDVIEALQSADPDQGWDCFAAAGEGVLIEGVPITWAPGSGATRFPDGTGIRIAAGQVMVLQVHYSLLEDDGLPDHTEVAVQFVDAVEREAHMLLMDGFLMTLLADPAQLVPGRRDEAYGWGMRLSDAPSGAPDLDEVEVMGILPHMHQRGRRMKIQFDVQGRMQCGADVDRWDFDWQQAYFLDDPISMRMRDRVQVDCVYDTSGDRDPVGPGFGTGDEMCLVGLYLAEKG